jgi:hypothetical protein
MVADGLYRALLINATPPSIELIAPPVLVNVYAPSLLLLPDITDASENETSILKIFVTDGIV